MAGAPFEAIVGADYCQPAERENVDGVPVTTIVRPHTARGVGLKVLEARKGGRPLVVRAGGSKLGWGNRADAEALVCLDLGRLAQGLELDPDEGIVTAQAGVAVDTIASAAAEHGKRSLLCTHYPEATVGGTIAVDPVGLGVAPDWRLRDDVLGLQVAHPNGELERCGGKVVKNVTGFDLVRLYCGSFGTLGVITEATLRLRPLPAAQRFLGREYETTELALAAARELQRLGACVVLLRPAGQRVRLFWVLEGSEADVARRAESGGGAPVATSDWADVCEEAADLAPHAEDDVRIRVSARTSDVPTICQELADLAGAASLRLVQPLVGVVLADVPYTRLTQIFTRAQEQRWLVFLERATGEQKRNIDVFGPSPDALPLMRALKARFDPERVLAPGRFIGGV